MKLKNKATPSKNTINTNTFGTNSTKPIIVHKPLKNQLNLNKHSYNSNNSNLKINLNHINSSPNSNKYSNSNLKGNSITINSSNVETSKQHKKLIQYRDFLLSLRKMDLTKIINQNKTSRINQINKERKIQKNGIQQKQSHNQFIQNYYKNQQQRIPNSSNQTHFYSFNQQKPQECQDKHKSAFLQRNQNINLSNIKITNPQSFIISSFDYKKSQNTYDLNQFFPINEKISENSLKFKQKIQPNQNLIKNQVKISTKSQTVNKSINKFNKFQIVVQNDIQEDDLYCDQDMEQLLNLKKPITPKLIHLNNFSHSNSFQRDYSTHRSSRGKDLSMPSIQERNMSQQSQQNFMNKNQPYLTNRQNKQRNFSHSISGKNIKTNQRKYNSLKHNEYMKEQKNQSYRSNQNENKQAQDNYGNGKRKSSFNLVFCSTNRKNQQDQQNNYNTDTKISIVKNTNKRLTDKQNAISTYDRSNKSGSSTARYQRSGNNTFRYSGSSTARYQKQQNKANNRDNININPFNFNITIPFSSNQSLKEKQKISLNVSQIIKRINSRQNRQSNNRQSKSSMSERSYQKSHKNPACINKGKQSIYELQNIDISFDNTRQFHPLFQQGQSKIKLQVIDRIAYEQKIKLFDNEINRMRDQNQLFLNRKRKKYFRGHSIFNQKNIK